MVICEMSYDGRKYGKKKNLKMELQALKNVRAC